MKLIEKEKVFTRIASINDLKKGTGKTVRFKGKEIAIFRLEDDRVKAIENRCPHKGGVLAEGIVSGEYVFCPLHDYKIDLSKGRVQAPDRGCVKTYEVRVQDEQIYLLMPHPNELVG